MNILSLNSGSSSVKFAVFEHLDTDKKDPALINIFNLKKIYDGKIEEIGSPYSFLYYEWQNGKRSDRAVIKDHFSAISIVIKELAISNISNINIIAHRFVHGGNIYKKPLIVKKSDINKLLKLNDLAPLHNPSNILGLKIAMKLIPAATQICFFDTAFHATLPKHAYIYPLPMKYFENLGIRRFGFHGISYNYINKIMNMAGFRFKKTIICHLGNGSSICAVKNGKSVDTSMGYTPLEGLMMGTRTGDIDPSLAFILRAKLKIPEGELYDIFNKKSGLIGISKKTYDLKELLNNKDKYSKLAVKMFCYRIIKYIGAYSACLNGLDALVFSGGIGENSYVIRDYVCKNLSYLGIKLDRIKNIEASNAIMNACSLGKLELKNSIFTINAGKPSVIVVKTDEELIMASEAMREVFYA